MVTGQFDPGKVLTKIKEIIAGELYVEESVVIEDSLLDDLGAESLDLIQIMLNINKEFRTDIPYWEDAKVMVKTVGDLISFVRSQLAAA